MAARPAARRGGGSPRWRFAVRRREFIAGLGGAATASAIGGSAAWRYVARASKVVIDDIMVPSGDPGIEIYVRNKRPADMASFRPESTVLFVHGSTFPSEATFDLKLDGMSWMDYIVAHGYDVYLMDIRGYGKSTRPKEMAETRPTRRLRAAMPGLKTFPLSSNSFSRGVTFRDSI